MYLPRVLRRNTCACSPFIDQSQLDLASILCLDIERCKLKHARLRALAPSWFNDELIARGVHSQVLLMRICADCDRAHGMTAMSTWEAPRTSREHGMTVLKKWASHTNNHGSSGHGIYARRGCLINILSWAGLNWLLQDCFKHYEPWTTRASRYAIGAFRLLVNDVKWMFHLVYSSTDVSIGTLHK